jgi:hypothetical protein
VRISRPLGVTLTCAALALTATACGSSAKSSDTAPTSAAVAPSDAAASPAAASGSPAASAGPDLSTMTAAQIVKAAEDALSGAQSVKIDLQTPSASGTSTVKLATDAKSGCTGTVTMPGKGTADVVVDTAKTTYLKPDDTYLKAMGGAKAVTLLHGKWLTNATTADPALAGMVGFCDIKQFAAGMDDGSTATKGQAATVNGQPALTLQEVDKSGIKSTLWVATQGPAYPLQASGGNGTGGTDKMTLSDYNVPVTVTVPSADQVVDFAKLKATLGH